MFIKVNFEDRLWRNIFQNIKVFPIPFNCLWYKLELCRLTGSKNSGNHARYIMKINWIKNKTKLNGHQKCPGQPAWQPDKSAEHALAISGRSGYLRTSVDFLFLLSLPKLTTCKYCLHFHCYPG